MTQSSIINLILLFLYAAAKVAEGNMDGYNKRHGVMKHGLKLISDGGLLIMVFLTILLWNWDPSIYIPFLCIAIRKPLIDMSYPYGYGNQNTHFPAVGTTSLTDKFINWTGVIPYSRKTGIPILPIIYVLIVFVSFCLAHLLGTY